MRALASPASQVIVKQMAKFQNIVEPSIVEMVKEDYSLIDLIVDAEDVNR